MRVVITTIVSLNPGDAAILEGSLVLLREALGDDVEVTVFDKNGPAASRLYPRVRFRTALFSKAGWGRVRRWVEQRRYGHRVLWFDELRYRFAGRLMTGPLAPLARLLVTGEERGSLETYLDADVVVASGGTYLVEYYNLLPPLLEYELVLALGRPLAFFPQSLGPFRTTRFRDRLRSVFARSQAIYLRDQRSADNLLELGVAPAAITVCADAAFALAGRSPAPSDVGAGEARDADEAAPRIAVSVREWSRFDDVGAEEGRARYLGSVAAAVSAMTRTCGARVTFLSTCQGIPKYWTDDARVADDVVALLPDDVAESVTVDRSFRQPGEIVAAFVGFDGVIATRMHAAILALCGGVPVLGIAYEFKTTELFEGLGMPEWAIPIEDLRADSFADAAVRFVHEREELARRARTGVDRLRERLRPIREGLAAGVLGG